MSVFINGREVFNNSDINNPDIDGGTADNTTINNSIIGKSTPAELWGSPSVSKGPAIDTSFTGADIVTASASTTVVFGGANAAANAIKAGYNATNPILGATLISNALTRYIVSWTNATTCVVDSSVTWAGTAITSVQLPIATFVDSTGAAKVVMNANGNVGIGTTTFGTSAAKVLAMGEGTAATTVITDGIQFWSANRDGVAGDNRLHIMGEKTTATVIIGDGQIEFNAPANLKGTGIVVYRQAGENLVYKDSCYIKTDGKMWKTDADSYTTMPTTRIALETINADAWGLFLEYGYMRDDTWTWTAGGTIYADTTTGAWTQTAPSGESDVLQIIGIAESATVAKVNPSWITTEIGLDIEDKSSAGYAITWAELTSVPKTFICDSADPKGFTFASAPTAADIGKSVRIVKSLAGAGTVTITAPAATYIDDSSAAGTIACPGSARASITLQVISATQIAIVAAVGTWTTA